MNINPQDKRWWTGNRRWGYEFLLRELGEITPETVIVDVGAGKGQYAELLRGGALYWHRL